MNNKHHPLSPIEEQSVVHWGRLAGMFGITRTTAMVVALLSKRGCPLTLEEMSDLLRVSRGALSSAVREARHVGLVRTVVPRGSKKLSYVLALTGHHGLAWMEWRIARRLAVMLDPTIELAEEALKNHGSEFPQSAIQRIEEVLDSLRKQRIILRTFISLDRERQQKLLDKMVAVCSIAPAKDSAA